MFANESGGVTSPLIPTQFVWPHGGRHVHLCGSFTRWEETLPMTMVDGTSGVFSIVCNLPPGYHQYKFIVDGEWRHDENQPCDLDPLRNVNNYIWVREIDHPHIDQSVNQIHLQLQGSDAATVNRGISSDSSAMSQGIQMDVDPMDPAHQNNQRQHVHHLSPDHSLITSQTPPQQQPNEMDLQRNFGLNSSSHPISNENIHAVAGSDMISSKHRILEFLHTHTAYELLPESGKVVALDVALPVKQAFHALYEQGVSSAPLWDSEAYEFVGMLSASDFIAIIRQLRTNGSNLSEEELQTHTISEWKKAKLSLSKPTDGRHTPSRRPLIYVAPDDSLKKVSEVLLDNGVSSIPVLHYPSPPGSPPQLLHSANLSGVLKCVSRHFRHVASSMTLLSQPIGILPIGTWNSDSLKSSNRSLTTLKADTPLTTALSLLLQENVSSLPVIDEMGSLIDIYSRSDIMSLAKDKAYLRLNLDELTIFQAIQFCQESLNATSSPASKCHMCLRSDTLRSVMDRLAIPGVRRLVCVEPGSKRVEGIITLSDVFKFLLER